MTRQVQLSPNGRSLFGSLNEIKRLWEFLQQKLVRDLGRNSHTLSCTARLVVCDIAKRIWRLLDIAFTKFCHTYGKKDDVAHFPNSRSEQSLYRRFWQYGLLPSVPVKDFGNIAIDKAFLTENSTHIIRSLPLSGTSLEPSLVAKINSKLDLSRSSPHVHKSLDRIRRMQPFFAFESGGDVGWWEPLYQIAFKAEKLGLVLHSVESLIIQSSGWDDDRTVAILIDTSEVFPQMTDWSFFEFAKGIEHSIEFSVPEYQKNLQTVSKDLATIFRSTSLGKKMFVDERKGPDCYSIPSKALQERWSHNEGRRAVVTSIIQQLDQSQSTARLFQNKEFKSEIERNLHHFLSYRISRLSRSGNITGTQYNLLDLFDSALEGDNSLELLIKEFSQGMSDKEPAQQELDFDSLCLNAKECLALSGVLPPSL